MKKPVHHAVVSTVIFVTFWLVLVVLYFVFVHTDSKAQSPRTLVPNQPRGDLGATLPE